MAIRNGLALVLFYMLLLASLCNSELSKEAIPKEFLPVLYQDPGNVREPFSASSDFGYHWVLTSCHRANYGRMLSTALLSGVFHGLKPASVSISWCLPVDVNTPLPSLLYNLRHSHMLNLFHMSPALYAAKFRAWKETRAYLSALLVPEALNAGHLPVMITEDDIMFAPDSHTRLLHAINRIPLPESTEAYMLRLYDCDLFKRNNDTSNMIWQDVSSLTNNITALHEQKTVPLGDVVVQERRPTWGTQGIVYSPQMTRDLTSVMYNDLAVSTEEEYKGLQDLVMNLLIDKYMKCQEKDAHCHEYVMEPSLVQHIGTNSAIWKTSGVSSRFHYDKAFPAHIAFPGLDSVPWRKKR